MVFIILFLICPSWRNQLFFLCYPASARRKGKIWSKALTKVICLFKVLRWTFCLYRGSSLVDPGAFQRECQYYISLSAAQQEKLWTQYQVSQYTCNIKVSFSSAAWVLAAFQIGKKKIKSLWISHFFQDFQVIVLEKYYFLISWQ